MIMYLPVWACFSKFRSWINFPVSRKVCVNGKPNIHHCWKRLYLCFENEGRNFFRNFDRLLLDYTHHITSQRHKLKFRNEIYKYLKILYSLNSVIYQYTTAHYLQIDFLPTNVSQNSIATSSCSFHKYLTFKISNIGCKNV